MEPTTDVSLVREILRRAFGHEILSEAHLSRPDVYAFANEAGAAVYSLERAGLYAIIVGRVPEADGASFKALLNGAISWLFIHTDALVVRGAIHKANEACRALVPHVMGTLPAREVNGMVITDTVFGRWARAYGIDKALLELRAAGQIEKADKLAKAVEGRNG